MFFCMFCFLFFSFNIEGLRSAAQTIVTILKCLQTYAFGDVFFGSEDLVFKSSEGQALCHMFRSMEAS